MVSDRKRAKALEELQNKADYEGGWWEAILGYGLQATEFAAIDGELGEAVGALKAAAERFEEALEAAQIELGVDPL